MPATGTPVFDGLTLTTVEVNLLDKSLTAEAAFINTKSGMTHGYTKGTGAIWSKETVDAAAALVASMEQDMARIHFGTPRDQEGLQVPAQAESGLGEHLASDGDDTKSV